MYIHNATVLYCSRLGFPRTVSEHFPESFIVHAGQMGAAYTDQTHETVFV